MVIQTPPHSPEEPRPSIPRRLSDGLTGSPPPPVTRIDYEDIGSGLRTPTDSKLEQALHNTRQNSGGNLPPPPTTFGVQRGSRAPANPFARTLATSEAQFGGNREQDRAEEEARAIGQGQKPGAGRPAFSVDAFKNILLTGSATPSPPATNTAQKLQDGSSSNTDTSSTSRASMFDQSHELHPESPSGSFEYHSPSSSDDEAHNEHSSLMGPAASRPVEEGPPAPPKPGQTRAGPQTVSFADFDDELAPARSEEHYPQSERPSMPRIESDLNKPLPPPPADRVPSDTPNVEPSAAENNTAKKAPPPPPPTARRRGQGESSQGRARSESNHSHRSAQPRDSAPSPPAEPSAKAAPPPPPSRRVMQQPSASPSPAIETTPSIASPTPEPPPAPSSELKQMPPPPPRRHASQRGSAADRTPSAASRTSLPREDSSNAIQPSSAAPPAPPPRRGGPKRNSLDNRRSSEQSLNGSERSAGESLAHVAEPADSQEPTPERDMLADLDAFQKEIDALRAQAAGSAG